MKLKIESNHPIPAPYHTSKAKSVRAIYNCKHPIMPALRTMSVGDSFFNRISTGSKELRYLRANAARIATETGKAFTVRKVKYGYRVWRTA
jgi:hypothetical protein